MRDSSRSDQGWLGSHTSSDVSFWANYGGGGHKCLSVNTTGGHKCLPGQTTGWDTLNFFLLISPAMHKTNLRKPFSLHLRDWFAALGLKPFYLGIPCWRVFSET